MRKIDLSKQALKFLQSVPPKHGRQLAQKLTALRMDEAHDVKMLKGTEEEFLRVDVGEYRIIYRYDQEIVRVSLIGKRNDDEVYKKFLRKHT